MSDFVIRSSEGNAERVPGAETNIKRKYTAASAFMEALCEAGVSYVFVNLGSDHPAFIEDWARARLEGRKYPQIIVCPHEMIALSAAHTYAQVTGKPQAVIVHVDCGTQNLGGAVHNAARCRIPVLIFAGASPVTQEGEMTGSRNEFIHWLQDVFDQRGIVREYMKYDNEIRSGKNIKQMVHRALQIAQSDPKGPVYLMAGREVLEEEVEPVSLDVKQWQPIAPGALPAAGVAEIAQGLLNAQNPLIVTSYLGRSASAVAELVKLCERLAIPVIESAPSYVNFPADHPMHLGYQWNTPAQNEHLARADFILVLDSDVPWIPLKNSPSKDCVIYHIDVDPLKENMPLWYIPSRGVYKADTCVALQQLNEFLDQREQWLIPSSIRERYARIAQIHDAQRAQWRQDEELKDPKVITPQYLTATIRKVIENEDTIVLNEAITNYETVSKHLPRNKPGSMFASGASSLGWHGGGGIGVKLAAPDKTVICLTGDGTFIFSNPTPVHMVAQRYGAPFLTVIYNNAGWGAPRASTLAVHPNGVANETDQFWVNFSHSAKLAKVAEAAGGAFAKTVRKPADLEKTLKEALEAVKQGRSAVVDVHLQPVSNQPLND